MASQLLPEGVPHATVVFVGHHQAGKSTTAGHILLKLGGIDKRTAERVERETSNRPTSRYAWVLDRQRLERERSMTFDLKLARCVLPPSTAAGSSAAAAAAGEAASNGTAPNGGGAAAAPSAAASGLALTVVDTPGHPDYLRNCIAGITQADVAVLVVDSRPAVLESPSTQAQTRDLGHLAANLASHRSLVVAVNQLDVALETDLAEQRFHDATAAVSRILKRKEGAGVTFVPVSGYTGDNLTAPSPRFAGWWRGGTLLDAIAAAAAAAAGAARGPAAAGASGGTAVDLPLRIPVIGVYKVGGIGTVAAGRVAGGRLRRGALLSALPSEPAAAAAANGANGGTGAASAAAAATTATSSQPPATSPPAARGGCLSAAARSVESFHESRPGAGAGDWVGCALKGVPTARLRRGCVLSDAAEGPARLAASFTAKIQMLRDPTSKRQHHERQLTEGYVMLVHVHTAQAPCRLARIQRLSVKGTREPLEGRFLREGDVAEVELVPLAPLVIEPYAAYPGLGRFAVRASAVTLLRDTPVVVPVIVAVGRVEAVQYVSNEPPVPAPAPAGPEGAAGDAKAADGKADLRKEGPAAAGVAAEGQQGPEPPQAQQAQGQAVQELGVQEQPGGGGEAVEPPPPPVVVEAAEQTGEANAPIVIDMSGNDDDL